MKSYLSKLALRVQRGDGGDELRHWVQVRWEVVEPVKLGIEPATVSLHDGDMVGNVGARGPFAGNGGGLVGGWHIARAQKPPVIQLSNKSINQSIIKYRTKCSRATARSRLAPWGGQPGTQGL